MNIAESFPARRQPDGTVWYRAAELDGKLADGWTATLAYAHPDYRAPDAPEPLPYPPDPWPTNAELSYEFVGPAADHMPEVTWFPDVAPENLPHFTVDGQRVDWSNPAHDIMADLMDPKWAQSPYTTTAPAPDRGGIRWSVVDTPTEEKNLPMTAASLSVDADFEDFNPPRFTEWCKYPLPPAPPRAKVQFGAWGWYKLPAPQTGLPSGFPRATTIAETLDDQYGLNRWKRRETAMRVYELSQMAPDTLLSEHFETTAASALAALVTAMAGSKVTAVDGVLDTIDSLLGGAHARELGECVHAWLEALCLGMVLYRDVPGLVRPHIDAALKIMAHRGMIVLPEYIERVILNDQGEETVAGRIDCIWELVDTGERVLGDWKTNRDLKYSWLSYGVQIGGVYGWATKMLTTDGKGWEPMPKLRGIPHPEDHGADCPVRETYPLFDCERCPTCNFPGDSRSPFAILLHVPSDQPERAAAITIDMFWGGEVMAESLSARRRRKEAKVQVPRHAMPAPSDHALRTVAARIALSKITSPEEGQVVYETYQDVWNDDLGGFAATVAELF